MGTIVHATAVTVSDCGVLILGPSGSGKSSLALGVITTPFIEDGQLLHARLVSDDQVVLERIDGRLHASPPATIAGKLEVRGLGIVSFPHAATAVISLAVELKPFREIERVPDPCVQHTLLGVNIPLVAIDASSPGAAARLYLAALRHLREETSVKKLLMRPASAQTGASGKSEPD